MEKLDQGDFIAWKDNPVTVLLFNRLKERRGWFLDSLLQADDNDTASVKKNIARVNLIDDILAIELEDLV